VEHFIDAISAPDDIMELRLLPAGKSSWHRADDIGAEIARLNVANAAGQHIYFGANPRIKKGARGDAGIALARCLFIDDDNTTVETTRAKIAAANLPAPTTLINSGHGVHAYWRLSEPMADMVAWRSAQKRLIAALGSDASIHNPERIMRLPGFTNHKPPVMPCELVEIEPLRIYTLAALMDVLPVSEIPRIPRTAAAAANDDAIPDGKRNSTLTSLCGTMRKRGMSRSALSHALHAENDSRCTPPLPVDEVDAIVDSVCRYPAAEQADDEQAPWPEPLADAAFHGLAGRIVRKILPHTEADEAALLVQLLVAIGNIIGRTAYADADGAKHFCNLNAIAVGNTSKGRKGTSHGQIMRLLATVAPTWAAERTAEGLSSGEGLIWAVRDKIEKQEPVKEKGRIVDYQTVMVDPGIDDKRLLVTESEFAGTLKVAQREGCTLSPIMRRAWDNGDLRTLTKNSPAVATGAHISIIGHITKDELLRTLDAADSFNGFCNRFLWICTRRSKCLPEGGAISGVDFGPDLRALGEVFENMKDAGIVTRDADARELWASVYPELSEGKPGLLGAVTSRAEAQVMRLSIIYALLDGSRVVRVPHLKAALAVWDYCLASAKYIFGQRLGDKLADELLSLLRSSPDGLSRTQINNHLGRNQPADRIGKALETLQRNGSVYSTSTSTGGRPMERWFYGSTATKETNLTK
jgi:hypothetical protein